MTVRVEEAEAPALAVERYASRYHAVGMEPDAGCGKRGQADDSMEVEHALDTWRALGTHAMVCCCGMSFARPARIDLFGARRWTSLPLSRVPRVLGWLATDHVDISCGCACTSWETMPAC
jgi:hypothetical protein